MYALRIRVNDELPVIAGSDELGVLNAMVNCVGKLGLDTVPTPLDDGLNFFLTVAGLTQRGEPSPEQHLYWLSNRGLQVGDTVRIELVESLTCAEPIDHVPASTGRFDEREFYEHCKQHYFALRDKYRVWEEEGGRIGPESKRAVK